MRLKSLYPDTPLMVLSPLAEGADRLAAKVVISPEIDARLVVPMPMRREHYERDFVTADSRDEFAALLASAATTIELGTPNDAEPIDSATRKVCYRAVGQFVAENSHLLIALWDGQRGLTGGTAEVVELKLTGRWPGAESEETIARGPVFHVLTPRERDDVKAAEIATTELYPEREDCESNEARAFYHSRIFKPLNDYNRDVANEQSSASAMIEASASDLAPDIARTSDVEPHPGFAAIRRHYAAADELAAHFRNYTVQTLFWLSVVAFGAALCFDVAVHLLLPTMTTAKSILMFGTPILTVVAVMIHSRARQAAWQDKYQDYRVLAEGLRVQFFWRVAGVNETVADHYMGRHRWALEWIRAACRSSIAASGWPLQQQDATDSDYVRTNWIESQAAYFERAAERQDRKLTRFRRRIGICFWIGAALIVSLATVTGLKSFVDLGPLDTFTRESFPLGVALFLITMTAVFAALTHNYVETLALEPQVRMYQRMRRIYRQHLGRCANLHGQQYAEAMIALGREALTENGDWLLTHRERPLEVPHH